MRFRSRLAATRAVARNRRRRVSNRIFGQCDCRCKDGRRAYEAISFDGSGDEAMRAVTLIGGRAAAADDRLSWPVTTAYFPTGDVSGDEMPDYTISMLLSENGVSRDILMDFGDFKMAGELTTLEPLEPTLCGATSDTLSSKP
nr:DUF1849 family protein [Marinicella sp. W31]MDC2877396.1 DUF1849 family protein [Marinicella sp. W31]